MSANELSSLIQRLEAVATRLEATPGGSSAASEESLSASTAAFDEIVLGALANFLGLSAKIGGDVAAQCAMVGEAFTLQRQFIELASKAKQPQQTDLPGLLKPTSDKISQIQNFREQNRRSPFFNHLSAISESVPALGWVAVSPAPGPFVKEMNDAGQFYTNRVLKDFKEKDKAHVEWVRAWSTTLSELQGYIKQYHTTGLVWNPKGGDAKSMMSSGRSSGKQAGPGGPPLPPPPPPQGLFDDITVTKSAEDTARNALFSDLNKGEDVTKGLKKVTADMQTHKNPNLRGSSVVAAKKEVPSSSTAAKKVNPVVSKPPKFELDGKKWIVEFFKGNPNIEVDKTQTNQSVYVYKCENSTVKVNGKCNNIILDGCKKCAVVFESVVSSVEFINCQSVQMQVLGSVPTISIDKTDGCQMFLSKDSLQTSIITAKSSEMNVMIPSGDEFVEQPVPEQFKTTIKGTKLNTTISESV